MPANRSIRGILTALALAPAGAWALGAGQAGLDFLQIGVGTRPSAMGSAFVGLADDSDSVFWNPAGLANLENSEAALNHANWLGDTSYESASYGGPMGGLGSFGGGFSFLSVPPFDNTGGQYPAVQAHGLLAVLGLANGIGGGAAPLKNFALGAGLKYADFSVDQIGGERFLALDLGALYRSPWRPMSAGLSVQNLGIPLGDSGLSSPLPLNLRLGIGIRLPAMVLTTDLLQPLDGGADLGFGVEYSYTEAFRVRSGFRIGNTPWSGVGNFSFGAGWRIQNYELGYAFSPQGDLGNTHRFSLASSFGNRLVQSRLRKLYESGVQLFGQGKYAEAVEAWEELLREAPGYADAEERIAKARTAILERALKMQLEEPPE